MRFHFFAGGIQRAVRGFSFTKQLFLYQATLPWLILTWNFFFGVGEISGLGCNSNLAMQVIIHPDWSVLNRQPMRAQVLADENQNKSRLTFDTVSCCALLLSMIRLLLKIIDCRKKRGKKQGCVCYPLYVILSSICYPCW